MGSCVSSTNSVTTEQLKFSKDTHLKYNDTSHPIYHPIAHEMTAHFTPEEISSSEGESEEDSTVVDRYCFMKKVDIVIDFWMRIKFGITKSDRFGHFLDHGMCPLVYEYGNWMEYPETIWFKILQQLKFDVLCSVVSSDGKYLFLSSPCFIYHLDIENRKILGKFRPLTSLAIGSVKYRKRSKRTLTSEVTCMDYHYGLLAGGGSEYLRIWDVYSHELVVSSKSKYNRDQITSINFSRNGELILTGAVDNTVCLWSVESGECLNSFNDHTQHITCSLFVNKNTFVTCSFDGSINTYNCQSRDCIQSIKHDNNHDSSKSGGHSHVYQAKINCDCTLLACLTAYTDGEEQKNRPPTSSSNGDGKIVIFEWPTMRIVYSLEENASSIDFHPLYPQILAVADKAGSLIKIVDIKSEECLLSKKRSCFSDICFTPDGSRVIHGKYMWNVSTLEDSVIEEID